MTNRKRRKNDVGEEREKTGRETQRKRNTKRKEDKDRKSERRNNNTD